MNTQALLERANDLYFARHCDDAQISQWANDVSLVKYAAELARHVQHDGLSARAAKALLHVASK